MKKLVIGEKPSLSTDIVKAIFTQELESVYIYNINPYARFVFDYPSELSFKEFPYKSEPKYSYKVLPYFDRKDKNFIEGEVEYLRDKFLEFDEFILAPDPDHTGCLAVYLLFKELFGCTVEEFIVKYNKKVNLIWLNCLTENSIKDAYKESFENNNFDKYNKAVMYGKVKRYFEFNFNLNSMMLFGFYGSEPGYGYVLTKYMILTLLLIKDKELSSLVGILKEMDDNLGTGKYDSKEYWGKIGSPASRIQILDNLNSAGFLEISGGEAYFKKVNDKIVKRLKPRIISITDSGESFINSLHSRSYDIDLPFRLSKWSNIKNKKELKKSLYEINGYLNKFFDRQRRYQSKD